MKLTPRIRTAGEPKTKPLMRPTTGRQPQQQSTQQGLLGYTRLLMCCPSCSWSSSRIRGSARVPTSGSVRVPLLTSFNIKGRLVRIESSALVARSGSLSPCDSESLETGREGIISGTVQREKAARKRGSTGNPNSAQTVGESPVIRQKLHEVQYCTCIACASSLIIFDTGCLCASCLNACVRVPDALSPRSIVRGAARCSSYAECESLLSPRTARVGLYVLRPSSYTYTAAVQHVYIR